MQGGMKQLELEWDKDLFFSKPLRVASGAIALPQESQPYYTGKACVTRDAGVMAYPTDEMA